MQRPRSIHGLGLAAFVDGPSASPTNGRTGVSCRRLADTAFQRTSALRQKRSFEHTACPTISIADIRANTLQLRFHFHNGEATKRASVIRSHSPEFSHR